MLVIRNAQMEAFKKQAEEQFIEDIIRHLNEHHRECIGELPDAELRTRVEKGLARARTYGIDDGRGLTAFVGLMFEIAPNFDERPAIHAVLTDMSIPSGSKMDELIHRTSEDDWEQAEAMRDERVWTARGQGG